MQLKCVETRLQQLRRTLDSTQSLQASPVLSVETFNQRLTQAGVTSRDTIRALTKMVGSRPARVD